VSADVDSADAAVRWRAHLVAVERTLTDASAAMPPTADLPPLPAGLASHAAHTLDAVRAAAADLTARRDAVAAELAELGATRPRPAAARPVYLDTTG